MSLVIKKKYKGILYECFVDAEDAHYLENSILKPQNKKHFRLFNKKYNQYVHRLIMGCVGLPVCVDHIDFNPLNNCKLNLRLLSKKQNSKRMPNMKKPNSPSKYKGVYLDTYEIKLGRKKPWKAMITANDKKYNIGRYFTEVEAAEAYNKAALLHFGYLADLNVLEAK